MNTIMNYRMLLFSVIVVLLCAALLVGAFLIHDSVSGTHLVKHGIMVIQTHGQLV